MNLRSYFHSIRSFFIKVAPSYFHSIRSFFIKVAPWAVYFFLSMAMLFGQSRDTIGVPSATFAVTLALASVTFSYARTLREGSGLRNELIFGGECLINAAFLFLLASVFKYASYDVPLYLDRLFKVLPKPEEPPNPPIFDISFISLYGFIIGFAALMVFFMGLLFLQMGVFILTSIASYRGRKRWAGREEFFFAASKAYQRHLTEIDEKDKEKVSSDKQSQNTCGGE